MSRRKVTYTLSRCDQCKKELEEDESMPDNWISMDVKSMRIWGVDYPSIIVDRYLDFCNKGCFIDWIELLKQKETI